MKKRQVKKYLGALLLSGALFCASLQTVYAEEVQPGTEPGTESGTGTDITADGGESQPDIVPEPLAESGTDTVSGETTEVNAPRITQDVIEWNGGLLEIPVDLGDYAADELKMTIKTQEGWARSATEITENSAVFSFLGGYYNGAWDVRRWFFNAGDYELDVSFTDASGTLETTGSFILSIPVDSQPWVVQKERVVFDGSEDLVFRFENGTNYLELVPSSLDLYIWTAMGFGYHYLESGVTVDTDSGTVTIDKDAFISTLIKRRDDYNGYGLHDIVTILCDGQTVYGETARRLNEITDDGTGYYDTDLAWEVDITGLDTNNLEKYLQPSGSDGQAAEFTGTNADNISVSKTDADVISRSALSYIQNNYADQLAALGDNYTVSSRLVLSEQTADDLASDVKEAFSSCAPDATVGKYYDISVQADVLQDGNVVEGLGSLTVAMLDSEIQLNVNIPADLKKDGRSFMMLHYHNGQGTVLESSVTNDTITFKTSAFSPYAIAYKDAVSTTQSNSAAQNTSVKNTQSTAPKTGDEVSGMLPAAAAVISLCVLAAVVYMRKRNCR